MSNGFFYFFKNYVIDFGIFRSPVWLMILVDFIIISTGIAIYIFVALSKYNGNFTEKIRYSISNSIIITIVSLITFSPFLLMIDEIAGVKHTILTRICVLIASSYIVSLQFNCAAKYAEENKAHIEFPKTENSLKDYAQYHSSNFFCSIMLIASFIPLMIPYAMATLHTIHTNALIAHGMDKYDSLKIKYDELKAKYDEICIEYDIEQ